MSYGYDGYGDGDMRTRAEDFGDDFSPFTNLYRSSGGYSSTPSIPLSSSYQSRSFEFPASITAKAAKEHKATWNTAAKGAPFMTGARAESYVEDTPEQQLQYTQFNQMASNDIYTKDGALVDAFQQEEFIRSKQDDYRVIAAGSKYIDYAPGNSTRHPPTAYSPTTVPRPGYSYPPAATSDDTGSR